MSVDDEPIWALVGFKRPSDRRFFDVTATVTAPDADWRSSDLGVGSKITREYLGVVHTVYVVTATTSRTVNPVRGWHRYIYRGERFKTLSAIAAKITGDRYMSGDRFFRLRRRRRGDNDESTGRRW